MKRSENRAPAPQDAIAMLIADHRMVNDLFKRFEKLQGSDDDEQTRSDLAAQACSALKVHMQIEDELFYPAAREALGESPLMNEAEVEHENARQLIDQLETMAPGDKLYDAKVTVLGELIEHHVREEETEMFPKLRRAHMETKALGAEMLQRQTELMEDMDLADAGDDRPMPPRAPPNHPASGSQGTMTDSLYQPYQDRN